VWLPAFLKSSNRRAALAALRRTSGQAKSAFAVRHQVAVPREAGAPMTRPRARRDQRVATAARERSMDRSGCRPSLTDLRIFEEASGRPRAR